MPKPITPLVACETFVVNEKHEVLLIQRSDSNRWALPGGFTDLGETPSQCAVREYYEETGYDIEITRFLGVFSSLNYKYVFYTFTNNEIVHLLFAGTIIGGEPKISNETTASGWFAEGHLPPLFDGHSDRIAFGFQALRNPNESAHFE